MLPLFQHCPLRQTYILAAWKTGEGPSLPKQPSRLISFPVQLHGKLEEGIIPAQNGRWWWWVIVFVFDGFVVKSFSSSYWLCSYTNANDKQGSLRSLVTCRDNRVGERETFRFDRSLLRADIAQPNPWRMGSLPLVFAYVQSYCTLN